MSGKWPKDFGKVHLPEVPLIWNSDQCQECIDLRQALRDLATRDEELKKAKEEIEQLQLVKLRLREDLIQYTRGFTDFTENTNEN